MTYFPHTPIRPLEQTMDAAKTEGWKYVYVGNVIGHPADNTYCPKCKNEID